MNQAEHDLLVIDAQDGSSEAMNALIAHHHRSLLRFAFSLCSNSAQAQDAVQDAWIEIIRRLRRLRDPRAFRGWVFHAVRWRVTDQIRRQPMLDAEPDRAPHSDTAEAARDRDRDIDLARAIDRLTFDDRETLELFYVAGLTIPEIALVQKIAEGTVKSRLHRARRQLRQTLGDNDEY